MSCDIFNQPTVTVTRWTEPDGVDFNIPPGRVTTIEVNHTDGFNFGQVVENRIESIRFVLSSKAKEYATGSDRFHNFNVAARMANTTPEKALLGMRLKHEVSVMDLVDIAESRSGDLTLEIIEEKIGDDINYLILLEGMLKKRIADRGTDGNQ